MTITGIYAASGPITVSLPTALPARPTSSGSSSSSAGYADMQEVYRRVHELVRALQDAQGALEAVNRSSSVGGGSAATSSSAALGLDTDPSYSTLDSSEEVNTVATSFSPFGPDWSDSSSSLVTAGGEYTGTTDDTLRFVVHRTRTVGGSSALRLNIYDNGGTSYRENIRWPRSTPPDTPITTSDGISISLGAGDIIRDDWFEIQVSASVGSDVDPDKPLNGTRNDNPNLEDGQAVTAGSFFVEGTEVTVAADDTLNDVLQAINDAGAGVTASYDSGSDAVQLVHGEVGANDIALTGDTSGFLDATKLSGATVVLGSEYGDLEEIMEGVAALSGTNAGTITVNDVEIAVDPSVDSLQDVLDRIEASEAGATASYDEANDTVEIASAGSSSLTLVDNGTDLLSQLNLSDGSFSGGGSSRYSRVAARRASVAMEQLADALQNLYATSVDDSTASRELSGIQSSIQSLVEQAFDDDSDLSGFGLAFDPDSSDIMDITSYLFERALLGSEHDDAVSLLVGSNQDRTDGLLGTLLEELGDVETELRLDCGSRGIYLNCYA